MEFSFKFNPPMDHVAGEKMLKEVKEILGHLGVNFLLSSGTCLGAIRDNGFIPWDDDLDLISIMGSNGLTDELVDTAVATFRAEGYFVYDGGGSNRDVHAYSLMKDYVRIGWECYRIVDNSIVVYPGTQIPATFFTQPKDITFLGEQFLVPNPPEEYLRLKYGEEWRVPKGPGMYELDVVEKIPAHDLTGSSSKLRVLDEEGKPVVGARVVLAGGGLSETDSNGYAEIILPGREWYALTIRFTGHMEVLYMEEMEPGKTYVYRTDARTKAISSVSGPIGTLGSLLAIE